MSLDKGLSPFSAHVRLLNKNTKLFSRRLLRRTIWHSPLMKYAYMFSFLERKVLGIATEGESLNRIIRQTQGAIKWMANI